MSHTEVTLRYVFEQYDVTDFGGENVPFVFPVTGVQHGDLPRRQLDGLPGAPRRAPRDSALLTHAAPVDWGP